MRAVVILVLLGWLWSATALAAGNRPALERDIRRETLAEAQRDPATLPTDVHLRAIAREHSAAMYRQGALGHVLADGLDPSDRVARQHRSLFALVAENVAFQQNWPDEDGLARRFVTSWMDSPGHRRNILARYDLLEIGCYGDRRLMYCTQLFASSAQHTADPIPFRQAPGAILTLGLARPPGGAAAGAATSRVSLAPAGERPTDLGAALDGHHARLPLPDSPGLFELHLWIPERGAPTRYRIVGGPYVCVTRARHTEPDCGM